MMMMEHFRIYYGTSEDVVMEHLDEKFDRALFVWILKESIGVVLEKWKIPSATVTKEWAWKSIIAIGQKATLI